MISREGDRLILSGRITMDTVTALFNADLAAGSGALVVDFAGVEALDSAAVSLLLSWVRRARRENVTLSFANIPPTLSSLAHLYDVAELLPLNAA